jgi:hypothetical protein
MKQETAVNFLIRELNLNKIIEDNKMMHLKDILLKAIIKERVQIEMAFDIGDVQGEIINSEYYYNHTYNK